MILFDFDKIAPSCAEFGIELGNGMREALTVYGNMLVEWNEKVNLTAITEPEEILYKHFYDCLLIFKAAKIPENASVIDVGTGAGFPGMVMKIARPDIKLTLLDGLNKRLVFLNEVLSSLGAEASTVHMRAEDAGRNPVYREKYDIACARAVAALPVLSEYCLPLVKQGGAFIAMKGSSVKEEIENSEKAVKLLGGSRPELICEQLRENEQRSFVFIKKLSQTLPKYPRTNGKISKNAL